MLGARRTSSARPNPARDALDDLVEVEVVCVDDDRVGRRPERRDRAIRVDTVAQLDLLAHRILVHPLATPLVLRRATADLLVQAGDKEELELGVGEDDGPDVATRHDHTRPGHLALLLDQRLAHTSDRGDHGKGVGVVGVVDAVGQLGPIRPNPLALHADDGRLGERCHRVAVARVDASLGREPRDGAIHQAAVDERKPEPLGDATAHRRLARGDATVDRDDHLGSSPVARRRASTSPGESTRQSPLFKRPSLSGPNALRSRAITLWPTACNMRRTWRCLPSVMTIRSSARPESRSPLVARTTSTSAGAVMPSSSLTPRRKTSSWRASGIPATVTAYSLAT